MTEELLETLEETAGLLVVIIVAQEQLYPGQPDSYLAAACRRQLDHIGRLIGPAVLADLWLAARAAKAETTQGLGRAVRLTPSA